MIIGSHLARTHRQRAIFAVALACGAARTVALIAQAALISTAIDRVFLAHEGLAGLGALPVLLVAVTALRAALLGLQEAAAGYSAVAIKSQLRDRLVRQLFLLGPAFARDQETGALATTAGEGIERLDAYVTRYLLQRRLSVLAPALIALAVLTQDWPSAAILIATAPIIPLLMILVGSYARGPIEAQWTALARIGARFLDAIQGLATIKAFGRGEAEARTIARISAEFRDRSLRALRYAFLSGLVLEFITTGAIAVVAVELGARLMAGGIPFQHALFILLLAPEFYRPLRELGAQRHAKMEGTAAAERIEAIMARTAPGAGWQVTECRARPIVPPLDEPPTIVLEDVRYRYPEADRDALNGVSLTLRAGARTALVGHSGAGKSTLLHLLLRFAHPASGHITAEGQDIAGMLADSWRGSVGYVPQRPHLFHGSVRENIALARPDATADEIIWAAEMAGAASFIERLPGRYEAPIGERGNRLSGGEAQRIAIARAFLKDAPLLLLDEPTSSLDPASETVVREALDRLAHRRTVLVAAHRVNTVYTADHIAVLEQGRVVQQGHHDELTRQDGPYVRLMLAPQAAAL